MRKNNLFLMLFFYLVLALSFQALAAEDKIIAIVNKDVITQKDLDGFVNFMRMQLSQAYQGDQLESKIASLKSDLMQRLIEDRLILQEAKKSGIKINTDRIKARVEQIKKSYPSDNEFRDALNQQGLSLLDIETKTKEQLLMYSIIDSKIKSKIVINPNEVTEFYQQNKEKLVMPEEREFQAVTVDNEETAFAVFNGLRDNKDTAAIAERYGVAFNKLTASADGQLKKEAEEIIFKLKPGEISPPTKINDKYYIFKLDSIIPPREETLVEAQDKIYNILLEKKMQQELANWIEQLKRQAYIKIYKE